MRTVRSIAMAVSLLFVMQPAQRAEAQQTRPSQNGTPQNGTPQNGTPQNRTPQDRSAQKRSKEPGSEAAEKPAQLPAGYHVLEINIDTTRYKRENGRLVAIPIELKPEPLIGVRYLVEYPVKAREQKIEGKVRFFATIKNGDVASVVLQSNASELLLEAVREAAGKLRFDRSWHSPDKEEFQYTQEVEFTLPDDITVRP